MSDSLPTLPGLPIFDGHNDTLQELYQPRDGQPRDFFQQSTTRHMDLPRARTGGFAGGMFAIFVSNPEATPAKERLTINEDRTAFHLDQEPPPDPAYALRETLAMMALAFRLEAASGGQVRVVQGWDDLTDSLTDGMLAMVLHIEGAEAIDTDLHALDVLYRAGLRSLGPVWSRPNAFGTGVPFAYPSSPDTGPGLTDAGKALIRRCNQLGMLVDLSHMNEKGFWDVAAISDAPLVATHSGVHAICTSARNLTDRQLDAIGESGGLVGVTYFVGDLRDDGQWDTSTPVAQIARHVAYIAERIGVEHVALGSDFDGAQIPEEMGDVSGLPTLIAALRDCGFDETDLHRIAYQNWLRVLRQTWGGAAAPA